MAYSRFSRLSVRIIRLPPLIFLLPLTPMSRVAVELFLTRCESMTILVVSAPPSFRRFKIIALPNVKTNPKRDKKTQNLPRCRSSRPSRSRRDWHRSSSNSYPTFISTGVRSARAVRRALRTLLLADKGMLQKNIAAQFGRHLVTISETLERRH